MAFCQISLRLFSKCELQQNLQVLIKSEHLVV